MYPRSGYFQVNPNYALVYSYVEHISTLKAHTLNIQLGLGADPVIEAIARLEFEDGLRTGVLPGGCWYPCGDRT